jgi:hypothetical protein
MKTPLIIITATLAALGSIVLQAPYARTASAVAAAPAPAATLTSSGPVVSELFTSQGCSSCPPADAVVARLARDPAILVISRPVTYWDRLGWKDTLGREQNTRLQRQYGDRAFDGANIYTPQLVVDGFAEGIGSQETKARSLVARAAMQRKDRRISVAVTPATTKGRILRLDGPTGQKAEVVLLSLASRRTVKIGRGENGGRSVTYTNVVLDEAVLGPWQGGKQSVALTPAQLATAGADRHAIIVRRGAGGTIIGSAVI